MDWARDDSCISSTLTTASRLFKYAGQASVVLKMVQSNKFKVQIWALETDEQWADWLHHNASGDHNESGLVLILAKRAGDDPPAPTSTFPLTTMDWLGMQEISKRSINVRQTETFASLGEKNHAVNPALPTAPINGQGSLRTLPFSVRTFHMICEKFRVHESILRAISRSDIPMFTCEDVNMGQPAYVYNCRTSNSWNLDLAVSATYFPVPGMTYGIVYGCPFSVERTILQRLSSVEGNPVHPLLIFGIIAEIELARHARIVDKNVNEVEAKIYELDSLPNLFQNLDRGEIMTRNEAKRSAWLDLTYLRNSLQTWHTQLRTMSDHVIELENCVLTRHECLSKHACDTCAGRATTSRRSRLQPHAGAISSLPVALTIRKTHLEQISACCDVNSCPNYTGLQGKTRSKLIDFGSKIKRRLDTIQCEYEEKIRDCTMRVDGMAMATQWAHGETTVEMATATNKESNVMKSISLVTMIFLPGTFFATIFSMTFFDWKSDSNERVSSYLWIYIVVTVFFTTITIGLWYYFVIHRRNIRKVAEKC